MQPQSSLCLLAVHAHPDDEVVSMGGTLPLYADRGVRTVLVTCTRGEEGEIVDAELKARIADSAPDVATAQEALAIERADELAKAVAILRISQAYQLGYRDSGMAESTANQNPRAFTNVVVPDATARLIEIVRRERPQVMVSYNEVGGYGHPDHIMAHRIALLAYMGANNTEVYPQLSDETPPWQPLKFYYTANSRDHFRRMHEEAVKAGMTLPFGGQIAEQERAILRGEPIDPEHPQRPPFGVAEDSITSFIDVQEYLTTKRAAMQAHRTQLAPDRFMLSMDDKTALRIFGNEYFTLVRSRVVTIWPEDDLFNGIE